MLSRMLMCTPYNAYMCLRMRLSVLMPLCTESTHQGRSTHA